MAIEFTGYFDDVISGWEIANKTAMCQLAKRCLTKNFIKKEAFEFLLQEIDKWDGRKI